MQVSKNDIPDIADFMQDFWRLVKDTWIVEQDDEYWCDLVNRITDLTEQYNADKFVISQLVAYADYLEEKRKEELRHEAKTNSAKKGNEPGSDRSGK